MSAPALAGYPRQLSGIEMFAFGLFVSTSAPTWPPASFDSDMPMPHRNYDITADGRHFVMLAATPDKQPQTIVVLNWLTDFRARISTAAP